MEILDSDSSPGVSLECSTLFSTSHKQFLKEKDIGSSKRPWPLDFGATGSPCSDGSSTGWLLSDMDDNSKPGPCGVIACASVSFLPFPSTKMSTFCQRCDLSSQLSSHQLLFYKTEGDNICPVSWWSVEIMYLKVLFKLLSDTEMQGGFSPSILQG